MGTAKEKNTKLLGQEFGKGVRGSVTGNILTLQIPLDGDYGPSSSGKTDTVASTGGFCKVPGSDDVSFSVNVCKKIPKPARS